MVYFHIAVFVVSQKKIRQFVKFPDVLKSADCTSLPPFKFLTKYLVRITLGCLSITYPFPFFSIQFKPSITQAEIEIFHRTIVCVLGIVTLANSF